MSDEGKNQNLDQAVSFIALLLKPLLFLILCAVISSCGQKESEASELNGIKSAMSNEKLIEIFNESVFGSQQDGVIKRWEASKPMVIALVGESTDEHVSYIKTMIKRVSSLAKTDIELLQDVTGESKYTVFLNVTDSIVFDALVIHRAIYELFHASEEALLKSFWEIDEGGYETNFLTLSSKSTKQLLSGNITVPVRMPEFRRTLNAGMMRLLGFTYLHLNDTVSENEQWIVDINARADSENFAKTQQPMSSVYTRLIEILYDPRLRSGLAFEETQPILRQIVEKTP